MQHLIMPVRQPCVLLTSEVCSSRMVTSSMLGPSDSTSQKSCSGRYATLAVHARACWLTKLGLCCPKVHMHRSCGPWLSSAHKESILDAIADGNQHTIALARCTVRQESQLGENATLGHLTVILPSVGMPEAAHPHHELDLVN